MADSKEGPKCGQCRNLVSDAQKAVLCDGKCNSWFHIACGGVSEDEYRRLSRNKSKLWHCPGCDRKRNDDGHGRRGAECAAELDNILLKLKTLEPTGEMESAGTDKGKLGRPLGSRRGKPLTTWLYKLSKQSLQGMLNDAGVEFTKSDCIDNLRLLVRTFVKKESDILLRESAGIPIKVWLQKMSKQSLQNILIDVGMAFNESDSVDQLRELVRGLLIRMEGSCLRSKVADCPSLHIKNQVSEASDHVLQEQLLAKENQDDLNLFEEIEIKREKIRIKQKIRREELKADPVSWKAYKEKERIRMKLYRTSKQCVYGVVWRCPMCCGVSFDSHVSLIRHLEKLPDTVHCPGCLKQVGSVKNLLNHLRTECFVSHLSVPAPLANTAANVIAPRDEETLNSKAVHPEEARLSLKIHDGTGPNSSVVSHEIPCRETASSCMSSSSKCMPGSGKGQEEDKQHATPLKQKKARSFFNCSVCRTTFTSVEEHVKRYHSEQEVLVNRLHATEVYRPQHAQKRRRVADGSVSDVTRAGFEHSSSTQQSSVSSREKTEDENKSVTVKNGDRISVAPTSHMLTRTFQNSVLNNVSSDSGRKREKILKVVLTRIADQELKKWLRSSSEEHGQKNEECDLNSVKSISRCTRIHSAVSGKLEHSISSNISGGERVEKPVETDAGKAMEIGRQVIFVVKKSDTLFNTKYKQQGDVGVTALRSDVARESSTIDKTRVLNEKANKGGILGASVGTDCSVQESDLSCNITHNYIIGRRDDTNRLIFRSVSCNSKQDSVVESTPVTVKKTSNSSLFPDTKGKNLHSVANRNVVSTIGTLLPSVQPNDIQSVPQFPALMISSGGKETSSQSILKPSGEMVSKGTPGIMYNNCGITVSGVWVGEQQNMDRDTLSTFMVNRYKIVKEEMSEFSRNKRDLVSKNIICDCINNKTTDLVVNKVIDETGKILNNLYLCLKCGMGFLMYLLFCKHICEKNNFVCSCPKSNDKVLKNAENNVVSEPEVGSWRKMVAVSASKNLVCSVCSNMFISDNLSFPDHHTVDLIQSKMPQNANRTTANYTCKICSIVTEKRRGRVLVSKVNDKFKEVVEIVVVDPNADCD